MNKNNTYKSKEESSSLNFQESNLKVNKNDNQGLSALLIGKKSKREIVRETNNSIKQFGGGSLPAQPKDNTHRLGVSADFAASQWFQILLIHINSRNKKLSGVLEPIGECQLSLNA